MKPLGMILLVMLAGSLSAQNNPENKVSRNYLSIEVDPAPFMLKGYSVSLKFSPRNLQHYSIMGSVFSSEFPDAMMAPSNFEKGWRNLKIEQSYALFTDYYLRDDRQGLHFGPSVFYYHKTVTLTGTEVRADFDTIYPNARIGYVFKPFRKVGLYVNPWLNVGKEINLDNNNQLGNVSFENNPVSYVLAVHIGYRFR